MKVSVLFVALSVLFCSAAACGDNPAAAQAADQIVTPAKVDAWDGWRFLTGDWVGDGGGAPGQGSGGFSNSFDLNESILIRRNYADFPATKTSPASRHEDLMIVHSHSDSRHAKAIYFDSEGHTINYSVELSQDGKFFTFTSDPLQPGPRFRLTYTKVANDSLGIRFEIAQPANPDVFGTYISARAHRSTKLTK